MTDKEKAIVMAHTGICMLAGEKFGVFHAYIEDIMGRPVYTHELATQSISDEIKEKSRDDFIKLCMEEQEPCSDAISRQAVLDKKELVELEDGQSFYCINPEDVETLPLVTPQKTEHWIPDMRVTADEAAEAIQNLTKAKISQEDIESSELKEYAECLPQYEGKWMAESEEANKLSQNIIEHARRVYPKSVSHTGQLTNEQFCEIEKECDINFYKLGRQDTRYTIRYKAEGGDEE